MKPFVYLVAIFGIATLVSAATGAATDPPIRVLIVDGYSNHDWRLTTSLIRGILEPSGRFRIAVSTAPATDDAATWEAWRPRFSDHDVVIQTCNDLNGGPAWPRRVQEEFETFVRNGGGVYVWHAGNNAFADWPAYNEMIGLGWRKKDFGWALAIDEQGGIVRIPAGEGSDTGHGARVDTIVRRLGEHPIHVGLPREWLTPDIEVYYYARGPAKNLEVLSHGFDPQTRMQWPLEWTVRYGQGRVYTSTFGHVWKGDSQPERMRCAGLQTVMVRALQWLARRSVDFPVPPDFPSAEKTSVRGEIPLPNQGESNSGDRESPAKVKAVYENLLRDLRLNAAEVPLLVGELMHADQHGSRGRHYDEAMLRLLEQAPAGADSRFSLTCHDAPKIAAQPH